MFDASAFLGPWPFGAGRHETPDELAALLAATGITEAAVSPVRAVLAPEPMTSNRQMLDSISQRREGTPRFVPVPILDPSLPCWREHLAECRAQARAIKIVPNYHGYRPTDRVVLDLAQELAENGLTLCVQTRMADERAHHRLMKVPGVEPADVVELAAARPDLPILVCGAYMAELAAFSGAANIHIELSFVESGYLLRDALAALGPDLLLLGTHAPLHMPAVGVAKLASDELDPAAYERISRANFIRLFGDPVAMTQGASSR